MGLRQIDLGTLLLDHPAAVAFHHGHGIDVRTTPHWRLASRESIAYPAESDDDVSTRVTYTIDGDCLTLAVGDDLSVVSVDRNRPDSEV